MKIQDIVTNVEHVPPRRGERRKDYGQDQILSSSKARALRIDEEQEKIEERYFPNRAKSR